MRTDQRFGLNSKPHAAFCWSGCVTSVHDGASFHFALLAWTARRLELMLWN